MSACGKYFFPPEMESALVQLLDEPPLMEVELHDKPELVTPPAQVRTPLSGPRFFASRTG